MVLGRSWGNMGCAGCASCAGCAGCAGCVACAGCAGCAGDRGSRPSEPREARRAKAEALMIMYFHLVSCLGYILLCIFVLKSFSRCSRPRARFVELIRCSRPWACFVELIRRFPFSAAQVSSPVRAAKIVMFIDFPYVFQCFLMFSDVRSLLVVLGVLRRSWGGLGSLLGRLGALLGRSWGGLGRP